MYKDIIEKYAQEDMVAETSAYIINNKTIDDYLALPDDERYELIDGTLYKMESPSFDHQRFVGLIHLVLQNYVLANKGTCKPVISPSDVQLDCDDKTMVQPDVYVICDKKKITKPRVVGAPDMTIEVLSPTNRYHDMVRKLAKYKNAGVREYWIVDPEQKKIYAFFFERSDEPEIYTFDDKVPVEIWEGKCKVDFKWLSQQI